jgi:hypothetical protein
MKRSTTWIRASILMVILFVVVLMAVFQMTSADPMPAAAAELDHANPTLVSKEISNGVFGGYAKVTFANPKNSGAPVVVELRRRPWSRNWQPLAEK